MKVSTVKLQKAISNIYNHLYANSEKKTPQGIAQEVGKILHTGMYLEEHTLNKPAFLFTKAEEKQMLDGNNVHIVSYVRDHFDLMNSKWNIYSSGEKINLKDFDIAFTCIQLNGIEVSDRSRDVFGDALEIFRSQWAKQAGGQFFTDTLVTHLAVNLLSFDPRKGDDLVDICAGTGGFLIAGLNRIRELLHEEENGQVDTEKEVVALASKSIYGKEYDVEVCSIANSTLKSRIGDASHSFVDEGDSLDNEKFMNSQSRIQFNSHKCVVGNPPFGTKITIKDTRILRNFELAKVKARQNDLFPSKITSRAPDILFLEQNIKLLIPGSGRMSLVVPYQILSGPQALYIRKWLLLNTEVISVIDLPADTFQPHTGTKGCLLTVKRRQSPATDLDEVDDYKIFMSTPKWIGHDRRGNPIFKKSVEGVPTDEILTDFDDLEKAFEFYSEGKKYSHIHDQSFSISFKNVRKENLLQLNAQFYKPTESAKIKFSNSKWKTVKLRDVCENIFYPGRFVRDYVEYYPGAVPFFGGKEIIQMVVESTKWIGHNHPKLDELVVKEGWILITRSGTTGIVSIVPEAWDGIAMSEHVIRVIPNRDKIDPYFLLTFLKTKYCQDVISKGVYGSVIDSITPEFIGDIDIHIPIDKVEYESISGTTRIAEEMRNKSLLSMYESINNLNLHLTI